MARARHRRRVRGGAIDRGGVGMRAALYNGPHSIEVGERPDPVATAPTDGVVRVVLSCVCGSDLWYWRGESPHDLGPIGHEFIGVVEEVGPEVRGIAQGELVIAPFIYCDGTCAHCQAGVTSQCVQGAAFGNHGIDGSQGEAVRGPLAGRTLLRGARPAPSAEVRRSRTRSSSATSACAAAWRRRAPTYPSYWATSWRDASIRGAFSISRRTSTASRRRTWPWTSDEPSSRW